MNFVVTGHAFGQSCETELIPNGKDIFVTDENKEQYVQLVCQNRMTSGIQKQIASFLEGFYEIIPANLISIFNERELELLISGLPDIDIDDWQANTLYTGYTAYSPVIVWFWEIVRNLSQSDLALLLQLDF